MTDLRPHSMTPDAAAKADTRSIRVQSTDGRCNLFDSGALDANYVARERPDGSVEVAIVVTDPSGELKEFIVRRYSHNEVQHLEHVDPA